ncbi:alpha/beta fold hydrolase [Pseudonocardia xinjiangensis]|uniref:Alpha/beta hydrolase n=1 Tax=Pseudonocardia xinjiangensis TaxID=75289 RepID=A0ABX1RE09_9PSEU|nr:alpha/beta fold hydrolase [Pseudonocardia xinjiangensis]NMH78632.1 alpha/beta hydrolase [Pseudonocardia xinjiangensis]
MRSARSLIAALVVAGLMTMSACADDGSAVAVADPGLVWGACPGEDNPPGMQCAAIDVPVNWAQPAGRTITLELARLPGTDPSRRIGTVFAIPGGPGSPGIGELKHVASTFTALRERFDVVTFDPRNVIGALAPGCYQPGPVQIPPRTADEYEAQAAQNQALMQQCRAGDPERFDHLDSASVARDIDAVRAAMGEPQLSLIGSSYGGVPAVAYARLFPDRVRAVFLDGVPDHTADRAAADRLHYQQVEQRFARFADWCATTADCALHGEDVPAVWQSLVAAADRSPIPVPGKGPEAALAGFDLKFNSMALGDTPQQFAAAIDLARNGDGSGFAVMPKQPMFPGGAAVHCHDGWGYANYDDYAQAQERAVAWSPNFSGLTHFLRLDCSGWPTPPVNPPAPLSGAELPPLLGAGSPDETPTMDVLVAAVPGSSVIHYAGPGHVLYQSGSGCVIDHADRYLTELTVPPVGTGCPADLPDR